MGGFVSLAASAANYGPGYENDLDHNLISYFVSLEDPLIGQKQLGNCVDIYCYSPDSISEANTDLTVDGDGQVTLTEGYIIDIIEVRDTLSDVIIPTNEYQVYNTKRGETFSEDNEYIITVDPSFIGASLRVSYRY